MTKISNRFYVTALEDGTTLHGNLVADKSLTQGWNGATAVPNWSVAANQPTIHLTLISGSEYVQPALENDGQDLFTWYYNDVAITWASRTDGSKNTNQSFANMFERTSVSVQGISMPAIKIVDNLASSSNVDIDRIKFEGSYAINGSGVSFAVETMIRISSITEGSHLGVINFHNGVSDITEKGQTLTLYGQLFSPDGQAATGFTTKWYLNDSQTPTNGTTITPTGGSASYTNAYQVLESEVVDHAIVKCEFYSGDTKIYTAYAAVDDMQDPEFMYIQYNGSNGNAASLRKGETATFHIWMGRRDDPTVISGYSYKVMLLDGDGDVILAEHLTHEIPSVDGNDSPYRPLPISTNQDTLGKAYIKPTYETVVGAGKKNLTGIVVATFVQST